MKWRTLWQWKRATGESSGVYGSTSNQELEERYDQWASEYDRDLTEDFVWHAPDNAARVLAGLVPANACRP